MGLAQLKVIDAQFHAQLKRFVEKQTSASRRPIAGEGRMGGKKGLTKV